MNNSLVPSGYVIASHLALILGLDSNYFTNAKRNNIELQNVELYVANDKYIYAKLKQSLMDKILDGYICMKINKDEIKDFEYSFRISRNCLIGMYR